MFFNISVYEFIYLRKISYSKFKARSVVFKYVGQCLSLSTEQNQVGIPTKLQNVTKNPPVKMNYSNLEKIIFFINLGITHSDIMVKFLFLYSI